MGRQQASGGDVALADPQARPYGYRADPAVPAFPDDRPLIVYDGCCALCTGWIRFVTRRDKTGRYRFAAAQSPLGQALYRHYGLDSAELETIILLAEGRPWFKFEGSIRIAQSLGFPWTLAGVLRALPDSWGRHLYDLLARNRFRLFGRRATCHRPDPGMADRFLA